MRDSPYVVKRTLGQAPLLSKSKPRLEQLDIELTERCNNDCIHCCINRPAYDCAAQAHEMTKEQIESILRQACDLGCLEVRFTGGEPLLRPDFQDVYLCARKLGMRVVLYTNACLITPLLADLFGRIPPLMPIEITVYGMHRNSYQAVTRTPGSFAQFWRGTNLLLERDVPLVVKSVILPQNRHEMDEFESWANTIPWMAKPPSYALFLDLRNRHDNPAKNALIKSLRLPPMEGLSVLTRDPASYRCSVSEFASKFMGPPRDVLFSCGAGHCICIDAYGRAQPCMGIRAPELTFDLESCCLAARQGEPGAASNRVTLAEALDLFLPLRKMRAKNPEYLRRCARCFLRGLCEQCPAKSWSEHGNLDTPVEYLCEVAHAQARYMGWLGENAHGWDMTDAPERG
jgi:sulfatase maturation enzyme AslB (radical SAM superfamily)